MPIQKTAKTEKEKALAILRTGAQRLRPVLLTKLTTILGLLPIRLRLDIDFINGTISYGAPSTEWWIQLSNAIIFGALFASPLTLVLTPCALRLKERLSEISPEDIKRFMYVLKDRLVYRFLKIFRRN